jgi:hypothetical protein
MPKKPAATQARPFDVDAEARQVADELEQLNAAAHAAGVDPAELIPQLAAEPGYHPVPIGPETRGKLVLFPFFPSRVEDGKKYPVMKGYLDTPSARVPVSAFNAMTEEGREFLSLSIGFQGCERVGGALFRAEVQDPANGRWNPVPGKVNDRFGLIQKTVKVGEDDFGGVYETEWSLRFNGKRKLSAAQKPYIKLDVYPARQAVPASAVEGCF